jgi:CTP synthase
MFCHVDDSCVLAIHDCKTVYHVPLLLLEQGVLNVLQKKLKLEPKTALKDSKLYMKWHNMAERYLDSNEEKQGCTTLSK